MKKTFSTRYNYTPPKGLETNPDEDPSRTYQECKNDCDINFIYRKYLSKGFNPPNIVALEARYKDLSNAQTYEEILNVQNDVKQMFDELPAEIRQAVDYKVDSFVSVISSYSEDPDIQEFQAEVFDKLGMTERKEDFAKIKQLQAEVEKDVDVVTKPLKEVVSEET